MHVPTEFIDVANRCFDGLLVLGGYALLKWINGAKARLHIPLEQSHAQDKRSYDLCARVGIELGAIRVYVDEFRNGDHYDSGNAVQRKSRTIEWVSDGVEPRIQNYKEVLCSSVIEEIDLVIEAGPSFTAVSAMKPGALKWMCMADRTKSIARCGIHGTNGKLTTMLGADFDTEIEPAHIYRLVETAGMLAIEFGKQQVKK